MKLRWLTRIVVTLIGWSGVFSIMIWSGIAYPDQKFQEIPVYAGFKEIDPTKNHFLLVGDTQKTSHWEFWRERNEKERKLILDEMVKREPAFVLHLGDLTTRGSSEKHWEEFDFMNEALRRKRIPFFPTLGNHEFYGKNEEGLQYYFRRFPHLMSRRWYSFTWKNIGLILLDSNFANLTKEQTELQSKWYWSELEKLEKDEGIDYVFVSCHEPPFTNSRVIDPNQKSKLYFADPFLRLKKTSFFFTGHSHSYERFQMRGKYFIVTGGGGGPRHKVFVHPNKQRFKDSFLGPELRFFHFCEIENLGRKLYFKVFGLESDGSFTIGDSITILGPL
jgi:predicted phosphodiesterase